MKIININLMICSTVVNVGGHLKLLLFFNMPEQW
jgi:hypothetical protein